MVLGELGRYPLDIHIKTRIINFWANIETKLSYLFYQLMYKKHLNGIETKWLKNVKSIIDGCGLSNIWIIQDVQNKTWLVHNLKQILYDQFIQKGLSECNNCSKGAIYNIFTNFEFKCQNYILSIWIHIKFVKLQDLEQQITDYQ
jgi:hypothetical protein